MTAINGRPDVRGMTDRVKRSSGDWRRRLQSSTLGELVREVKQDRVTGLAAEVTFFVILSIVPGLVAIVASLGFGERLAGGELASRAESALTSFLQSILTREASAAIDVVRELFRQEQPALLSVAMAAAVWGFSRGHLGLIRALEVAHDLPEGRWWKRRMRALLLSLGSIVILALLLAVVVVGPLLGVVRLVFGAAGLDEFVGPVQWLRFPVAFALLVGWAWLLFHAGPALRTPWRADLPGAVFAAVMWLLASVALRVYLDVAGGVNQIFGVLGGLLVAVVWLYLLNLSLLVGGELNAALRRKTPDAVDARGEPGAPPECGPSV